MKAIFWDVDTQLDFLYPAGALYVPGAERIVATVARLNHHAAANGMHVVSDVDAHSEDDPEFHHWPPHCVAGTAGQQKPQSTLLDHRAIVPFKSGGFPIDKVQQLILEKPTLSCFADPNLPALLRALNADKYVLYGVVTEICVRHAALGLLDTGKRVELVTDAVQHLNEPDRDRFFEEFTAHGGKLTTADEVCSTR